MSTVDDIVILTRYEETETTVRFFDENDRPIFSVGKLHPDARIRFMLPVKHFYVYDCREDKVIYRSFEPV